jgi:hypothetical protein
MKPRTPSDEARPASTWIERFAIPVTVSAMEAQPIALVIALLALVVARNRAAAPIGAAGIALSELTLLWWALFVEHFIRRSAGDRRMAWLHLPGWLVVLGATIGIYLFSSAITWQDVPAILLLTIVVTWLWRRNMYRVQTGFAYEQCSTSFKVSFGVMLGILLLAVVFPELQALRDVLATSLPLFFLSGLVTLSLVRLGAIRSARRSSDGSLTDPTRSWLLGLSLFGGVVVALVILVESIFTFSSFEMGLTALTPLWNALGTLVTWIIYAIIFVVLTPLYYFFSFVLGLLVHNGNTQQQQQAGQKPPFQQQMSPHTLPLEVITIGRWVFLAIALVVIFFVVRASLRRWFTRESDEGVEEEREGLDARSLLGESWRAWWNRRRRKSADPVLDPLDPTSARARYREMLQAVATEKGDLARKPAETPAEYEVRLLAYLGGEKHASPNWMHSGEGVTDAAILDELTHAYALERYGGKRTDDPRRAYLQTWVPRLVERITGRTTGGSPRRRTPA